MIKYTHYVHTKIIDFMEAVMATDIIETKVFKNGNSQAVRIPKAFNLEAERVYIHQKKNGDLVISTQSPPNKWDDFLAFLAENKEELHQFTLERDMRSAEERELF